MRSMVHADYHVHVISEVLGLRVMAFPAYHFEFCSIPFVAWGYQALFA